MAGVRGEKLLTASDLAALCEVDLKTIHNWVDRGRIAHFRTPGRHLRFRTPDVADFLGAWGYAVPREIARASARSVMVVGSLEAFAHVERVLGEGATLRQAMHPYDALILTGGEPGDAFVIEPRAIATEIDVTGMLEAMHRACPEAVFVVLADEALPLPPFATRIGRADSQALKSLLLPEAPPTPAATTSNASAGERGVAAAASSR